MFDYSKRNNFTRINKYFCLNLLLLFFIFEFPTIKGQTDTSFWFVAPRITYRHDSLPQMLRLASMSNACDITISEPANPSFTPITSHLAANSSVSIDLSKYIGIIENRPPNEILNYGIYIKSSGFITAYYDEFSNLNPEIFALKGMNALGTRFYISGQNVWYNNAGVNAYSAFDIVATEDNTSVTIVPTNDIVGHAANIPFTIKLNKGQTYSARGVSQLATGHLEGSIVTSDKQIAITISDDSVENNTYGGCYDLIGDQTIPVDVTGTEYIICKGSLGNHPDKLFITATEDITDIYINGNKTPITTIAAGATYAYDINSLTYIETSKPAYVYHVTGFGCEVGSAILPSTICAGSTTISFVRSLGDDFELMLIVRSGFEGNFILNGNASYVPAASFVTVPGTNSLWKAAKIAFNTGQVPVGAASVIRNTRARFGMGMITASGSMNGCSYGYFSDFKFTINVKNNLRGCSGDTLQFSVDTLARATYQWTGPNGFKSNLQNPVLPNITTLDSGIYTVTAYLDSCPSWPSKVHVVVNPKPTLFTIPSNAKICKGDSVSINIKGANIYSWTPNTGLSNTTDSAIIAFPAQSTTYIVKGTNKNGCKDTVHIPVIVLPKLIISVTPKPATICSGSSILLTASGADSYTWSPAAGLNTTIGTNVTCNVSTTTTYTVTGTNNICTDTEKVVVYVTPLPIVKITPSDTTICNGNSLNLMASGAIEYTWSPSKGLSSTTGKTVTASPNISTTFTVTGTDSNGCTNTINSTVVVSQIPHIKISPNPAIYCLGSYVVLTASSTDDYAYTWAPASGLNSTTGASVSANPLNQITYTVTGIDSNKCKDTAEVVVKIDSTFKIKIIPDSANICQGKSVSINVIGSVQYTWSPSNGLSSDEGANNKANPLTTTTYRIIGIDNSGCSDTAYIFIKVKPSPVANFTIHPDTVQITNPLVSFTDESTGSPISWHWTLGNGESSDKESFEYKYSDVGRFLVNLYITNIFGCTDSIYNYVKVDNNYLIFIPNAFSPYGKNNIFYVYGICIYKFNIIIFDRWGQKVFESNDITKGWDGIFNGKYAPTGTYVYKVIFKDAYANEHTKIGYITLIK